MNMKIKARDVILNGFLLRYTTKIKNMDAIPNLQGMIIKASTYEPTILAFVHASPHETIANIVKKYNCKYLSLI